MYVLIQNQGEIDPNGIRLLGQSVKESADSIGQFGTGLKEVIALCLRRNTELIIFSGLKEIRFGIREIQFRGVDVQEIVYTVDGVEHPMNISVNLGKQDWNSEWQILREIICNAQDEGGLHIDKSTDLEVCGVAGATRVYIEATYDIMEEYEKLSSKLLFLTKRVPLWPGVYTKPFERKGRVYKKGVFIREIESLYDYELCDLKLTESRTAAILDIWYAVARLKIREDEYFEAVLEACKKGMVDLVEVRSMEVSGGTAFGDYFNKTYTNAVICWPTDTNLEEIQSRGYEPVRINNPQLANILTCHTGCRSVEKIIYEDNKKKIGKELKPHPMWHHLLRRVPPVKLCDMQQDYTQKNGTILVSCESYVDKALLAYGDVDIEYLKDQYNDKRTNAEMD